MNLFVKLAGDIPPVQKSFFRNFISFIIASAVLYRKHIPFRWKQDNLKLLLARASFGTIGFICNYYAISSINLSDASMLNKISPFFTILFSALFLKEKVTFKQMGFISLAFIGSLFIIKPGMEFGAIFPSVIGFIGGVCAGAAYTMVRALGLKKENGNYIVFFFSGFSCLVTLPYLLFNFQPMNGMEIFYLMLVSIFGAGGQYALTAAYLHAPAKEISIYDYTIVIFSGIWSFLFFDAVPDALSIVGYVIVFCAAIFMFFYNKGHEEKEA